MNKLRDSFNSSKSKLLLALAIIGTTNWALVENLSAQTTSKPQLEQVDKNDAQRVSDFMKPLNLTIPAKWIKFASDNIQMLDADGIASAQMILQQDLPKVAAADRVAYVLMAFDAIHKAYDKEDHITASTEFFEAFLAYGDGITSITNRFAQDRQKRSEIFIAQNEEIANQAAKEAEDGLLKLYKLNPNDSKLKTLATGTKETFDKYWYKYSWQTAELFKKLGIN